MAEFWSQFVLFLIITTFFVLPAESGCTAGCNVSLASYHVHTFQDRYYVPSLQRDVSDVTMNYTLIAVIFNVSADRLSAYNNPNINGSDDLRGQTINVSFPCDCINGSYLGHYIPQALSGLVTMNNINKLASDVFSNLTTPEWIVKTNPGADLTGNSRTTISVTINCSCGDPSIPMESGLLMTYPLKSNDSLAGLSQEYNVPQDLLQKYNPGVNFNAGNGIVFLPVQDPNGSPTGSPIGSPTGSPIGSPTTGRLTAGSHDSSPNRLPAGTISGIVIAVVCAAAAAVGAIIYWSKDQCSNCDCCFPLLCARNVGKNIKETNINGGENKIGAINPDGETKTTFNNPNKPATQPASPTPLLAGSHHKYPQVSRP